MNIRIIDFDSKTVDIIIPGYAPAVRLPRILFPVEIKLGQELQIKIGK